jgi:hypothetical protein
MTHIDRMARLQARHAVDVGGAVDLALVQQLAVRGIDRCDAALDCGGRHVEQDHAVAGIERHLDDAAAHGAGADDADQVLRG